MVERSIGRGFLSPVTRKKLHLDVTFIHMLLVLKLLHCMLLCCGIVKVVLLICSSLRREEGGHKPGTLRDFLNMENSGNSVQPWGKIVVK